MRRWREIAFVIAGVTGFIVLAWRYGFTQFGRAVTHAQPIDLAVYACVAVAVYLGYGLRWLLVSRTLGARSRLGELVSARIAGDGFGSMLPAARMAGDPVRVVLVTRQGTTGPLASAAVAVDRILELIGDMLCTIGYSAVFLLAPASDSIAQAVLVLVCVMVALLASLAIPLVMLRRGVRPVSAWYRPDVHAPHSRLATWMTLVRETEDHLIWFFQHHPRVFLGGLAATLLIEALIVVEYYFLLAAFSVPLEPTMLLVATLMTGLARSVPTTAAVGALEGAQVALFAATSGEPATGFLVALVMRLHETVWIAAGMTILLVRGISLAHLSRTTQEATA